MFEFLAGTVVLSRGSEALRVVASHKNDSTKRWVTTVDPSGHFVLSADSPGDLFDAVGGTALSLVVRVMQSSDVIARQRLTLEPAKFVLREVRLVPQSGDGLWVGGSVRTADGRPASSLTVDVNLVTTADESIVARATTDQGGHWESRVASAGRRLDLRIAARAANGDIVAAGPLRCDVQGELEEALTVPDETVPRVSRFDRLHRQLEVELEGRPIGDIGDTGIDLIACRIGERPEAINQVRASAQWQASGASAAAAFAISATAPITPSSVLNLTREELIRTLDDAVTDGIVPAFRDPLERIIGDLRETAASFAVDEPPSRDRRAWLQRIGAPSALAREVVRLERLGELDAPSTWDRLARTHPPESVTMARDGVEMSHMGLTHAPLVRLLSRRRQASGDEALSRVLPRLGLDEIETLLNEEIDGEAVDVPPEFQVAEGGRRAFALGVIRTVERRFPTATVLHARARTSGNPVLSQVVELNPALDLRRPEFTRNAANDRLIFPAGAEPAVVMAELRLAQRQFAISPVGRRVEAMAALQRANLDSAAAVVTAGPAMFVRAVGGALDVPTIRRTYRLAAKKSATGVALITRHMAALEVYNRDGPLAGSTATLETLFGSMSFCACEHCRSVLSPAAYLAQLLQFIRRIPVGDAESLFDTLVTDKHRSDVPNLQLDCANSETALPYIDLVNEVLEFWLPRSWLPSGAIAQAPPIRQTTRSEQELRAHPEYLLTQTYVGLRDEVVFPMSMPFDLFFVEVVAYLKKVGVSWARTLSALTPTSQVGASNTGAAGLGLSPSQMRIIVDEHPGQVASMWGVDDLNELNSVGRFMDRANLTFPELMDLLATRFFQRATVVLAGPLNIRISPEPPCDIAGATFEGLPTDIENLMGRTNRFIRLWRATGWTMREVDLAIINVGQSAIDRDTIANFARVLDLGHRFPSTPRIHMLAWWRNLETRQGPEGAPSHYDELFFRASASRSIGVEDQPIATIERLLLNEARTELMDTQNNIHPLLPRLAGAFQVPVAALEGLLEAMGNFRTQVDLATLSMMFRHVSFGRAIGVTPAQVRRWAAALGIDPFESPANTIRFLALRQSVLDLGAGLDRLSYALGLDETGYLVPDPAALTRWLAEAVVAMQTADSPDLGEDATPIDALHFELMSLLEEVSVLQAMSHFGGATASPASEEPIPSLEALLNAWVSDDVLEQAQNLVDQGEPSQAAFLLTTALETAGRAARQRRAAATSLGGQAGIDASIAELLVAMVAVAIDDEASPSLLDALSSQPVQDLALDLDTFSDTDAPAELQALVPALRRWHRGVVLIGSLHLNLQASTWLVEAAQAVGAIELHRLAQSTAVDHDVFVRTIAIARLIRRQSGTLAELFVFIEFAADHPGQLLTGARLAALAAMLGWDPTNAAAAATQLGLRLRDVLDGSAIERMDEALELSAAGDITAAQLVEWVNAGAALETANEVKDLVSARVSPERWAAELGAVRDPIREQQRDAMVASYLHHNPTLAGPGDLYAEFLIDPDMNACRTASRIQQGIAAVQRLMLRVMNGLEGDITVSEKVASEWTWMSSYRVWEANLKVFLWPENWLDPKLRLDRTPLFDEVSSGLAGAEADDQHGETAVREYLYGLRAIAKLDVAGIHHEKALDRLHIFARSTDSTHAWYHRIHAGGAWTPWRDVPLQIDAPEVLPLTYRNQLMVVWPKLKEATIDDDSHTEVRLAWAFYEKANWSEIQECDDETFVADNDLGPGITFAKIEKRHRDVAIVAKVGAASLRIIPIVDQPVVGGRKALHHFVADRDATTFRVSRIDDHNQPFLHPLSTHQWAQGFRGIGLLQNYRRLKLPLPNLQYSYTNLIAHLESKWVRTYSSFDASAEDSVVGFDITRPTVVADGSRVFVLWPRTSSGIVLADPGGAQSNGGLFRFRFECLYHPFASKLLQQLARAGVEGIYRPRAIDPDTDEPDLVSGLRRQRLSLNLIPTYQPTELAHENFPEENFDFSPAGAYGEYNWELFFHLPLLVAAKLRTVGRFADSKRWLERVFDPRGEPVAQSPDPASWYWMTKPLWQGGRTPSIEDELELLSAEDLAGEELGRRNNLKLAIERWRARPFEPHIIAQLRPGAYQRQTVMSYLDTLIAWGDSLFSRRTAEALDEATQLYLLAADLLGPRPLQLPRRDAPTRTFNQMAATQDEFGNFFVEIENHISVDDDDDDDSGSVAPDYQVPPSEPPPPATPDEIVFNPVPEPPPDELPLAGAEYGSGTPPWALSHFVAHLVNVETTRVPYFCIPPNEKLLGYWDTVEDRLFKLRNCLDLEGQRLVPDLFAPPIDPGALVAAIAQGVDLASAIDDLFAPLPHYRFHAALAKAKDLNALVRDLGRTVLSAIERADAERFSVVSNQAEEAVLQAVGDAHQQRLQEASDQIEVLNKAKAVTQERASHFENLIKEGLFETEEKQRADLAEARDWEAKAANRELAAGVVQAVPSFTVSRQIPPDKPATLQGFMFGFSYGSPQIAAALDASAEFNAHRAGHTISRAALRGTDATDERRQQEWKFQESQAKQDGERIDAELTVANVRREIASRELRVHQRNIATNRQIREFLQAKYTQVELHDWMANAAATVHRAAFNLAIDLARKVQRAYRYELADPNATFIDGGYWESNRKGLLAGERLALDLERMEVAYIENNRREHELLKRVSLAQIDPGALLQLRYTGSCEIDVPEPLFDLDHPTHFLRRLRRVAVTIPAIAGPYTNVNATLTLNRSQTRPTADAEPLVDLAGGSQSIAISTGQSDTGVFSDSQGDTRRMPFEGRGAISRWQLTLPPLQQFDYRTIADCILELHYTARSGATAPTSDELTARLNDRSGLGLSTSGWARSWSVRTDFPDAWQAFRQPGVESPPTLALELSPAHFPFALGPGASRRLRLVHLFAETSTSAGLLGPVAVEGPTATAPAGAFVQSTLPGTLAASVPLVDDAIGTLTLAFPATLDPSLVRDLIVLIEYDVNLPSQ